MPSTLRARLHHGLFAAALTLPGLSGAAPVAVDAQFKPAEAAPRVFKVGSGSALKGLQKVALTQLAVEFLTYDTQSASTSRFATSSVAHAQTYFHLGGVGEAQFQALAERAQAAVLDSLKAAGLEVLPPAELRAAPGYRKLADAGQALPMRESGRVVVGPAGTAVYGLNRAQITAPTAQRTNALGALGNLANIGSGLGSMSAIPDAMALQKELGVNGLIEMHLRVHFVELTNENKGFFGRNDAAVVSARAYPVITATHVGILTGTTYATMTLKDPLVLDPAVFVEVKERPTTPGEAAAGVLGAVLNAAAALAGGTTNSSKSATYDAIADPARYEEVVGQGLKAVAEMVALQVQSNR